MELSGKGEETKTKWWFLKYFQISPRSLVTFMIQFDERAYFSKGLGKQPQLSNEKKPGWLGYVGIVLPKYKGIIMHHYKDPY